jgi:predicted transcriptional regulator
MALAINIEELIHGKVIEWEGRGTGIPSIKRSLINNQSPEPIFETDEQCLYFLTVLPVNPEFLRMGSVDIAQQSDQVNDQVNDQVKTILSNATESKSRKELLALIKLKNHFDNYKRYIEPLITRGWLEMTIPDEPNNRNQKYITTEAGKKILKEKRDQESDQVSDQVNDQVKTILSNAIESKSRKELLALIKLKNHFDNYKRHIEPLITRGWLDMTIPNEPNSRNQKYITTETGKKILKEKRGSD